MDNNFEKQKQKLKSFFLNYELQTAKKDETLIFKGDEIKNIFFLEKGFIKEYSVSPNGDDVIIHIFKAGSYLPILYLILDKESPYFFSSFTSIRYREIPKEDFLEFFNNNFSNFKELLFRLAGALDNLSFRVEQLITTDSKIRTINSLLFLAKHFGKKEGEQIFLKYKFNHKDIASFAGLARETVSRVVKKLEEDNILSKYKGRYLIKNINQFQRLSNIN